MLCLIQHKLLVLLQVSEFSRCNARYFRLSPDFFSNSDAFSSDGMHPFDWGCCLEFMVKSFRD